MPTHVLRSAGAAVVAVVACCALLPAVAGATKPADVRVVDSSGETLAEHTQYTGKAKIKTRGRADCFGEGTGGSGDRVTVPRATALGVVEHATKWDRDIKPVLVSDAFDFGLAVCGFGDAVASESGFWYLKINHVGSQIGGDQARLKKGDEVLWYLIEDFNQPTPTELMMKAPARSDGSEFTVKVWEYADDGSRRPAEGAAVTGAEEPTGTDGRTTVDPGSIQGPLPDPTFRTLRATREGSIPSQAIGHCIASDLSDCQAQPATIIRGTRKGEVIRGTRGDDDIAAGRRRDVVRAGRGDDVVDVKGGGKDVVRCGAGDDRVRSDKRDRLKGCG